MQQSSGYLQMHRHQRVSSVQSLSRVQLFATPRNAAHQASLSIPNSWSSPKPMPIESGMPSNHLILCHPFSCLQSFPESESLPMSWFFASGGQSIGASVLPVNIRVDFLQDWLVGSPCSPRDSQESFPTPQFRNINSSALSFLYGPTLTSIHDYWKNHSFEYTDFCQQSNVSAF